jgi:DNA repair protein RecO (recombination protein O)
MILQTNAVVLRSIDYGETSQIVTLFTRQRGKVAAMAKGARRSGSRFGSSLQPMSYSHVVIYYKQSRGVQTLSESSHVHFFDGITRSLERLSCGLRIVELVHALMQEEEQNSSAFNLVIQALERLNRTCERTDNLLFYFQLRFASILGFAPDIDRDALEHVSDSGVLSLENGTILPQRPPGSRAIRAASRKSLRAFAVCALADLETVMRMRLNPSTSLEVGRLVDDYLRYHVEDAYPTRAAKIVGQMLEGSS